MSFMDFLPAIGGSILAPILGYQGQKETNAMNAEQADKQMQFQERMSNTAHQREVKDLKEAGLNPILSANGGSSTPGGAQAVMGNAGAELSKGLSNASATALQALQLKSEMDQREANVALTTAKVGTELKQQEILSSNARTAHINAETNQRIFDANEGQLGDYYKMRSNADTATARAKWRMEAERGNENYYRNQAKAHIEAFKAKQSAEQLDRMNSEFDKKTQIYDKVQQKVDNTLGTLNSAVDLAKPGLRIRQQPQDKWIRMRKGDTLINPETGEIK